MLLTFLISLLVLYTPAPSAGRTIPWYWCVLGVTAVAAVNALAWWAGTGLAARARREGDDAGGMRAVRVFRTLTFGIAGFVLVDAFALRWPALVERVFDRLPPWLGQAPVLPDLLLLTPVLGMIATAMALQYRMERGTARMALSLRQYLSLRMRTELAIVLLPWLLLALVSGVARLLWGDRPGYELVDTLASLAVLLSVVVAGPSLLKLVWETSPLRAGPLRDRLAALCARERFRCTDILVWHTHNHLPNAGVIGLLPWLRYVLLTDALLSNCSEDEVEAIFAHEAGHVRHHHLGFYLLFALAFVCLYINAVDLLAGPGGVLPDAATGYGPAALLLVLTVLYWVFGFGFLSRRLEQQADVFSLRVSSDPGAFVTALHKLSALSGVPSRAGSWRHFSIARRTAFLEAARAEPELARASERRVRLVQIAVVAVLLASVLRIAYRLPDLIHA